MPVYQELMYYHDRTKLSLIFSESARLTVIVKPDTVTWLEDNAFPFKKTVGEGETVSVLMMTMLSTFSEPASA